jgi:cell division septation protein DedD
MRGVFDDEDLEPAQQRHETELTLSATVLIGLCVGLVLICGVCFGAGYLVGHRGSQETPAIPQGEANESPVAPAGGSKPKPSAIAQTGAVAVQQSVVADVESSAGSAPNAVASTLATEPVAATGSSPGQAQVHPALTPMASPLPAQSPTFKVEPALAPGALMVQIAAVSHNEDADVLVNALRKRGYAVTARRDAADGLIHVRIGPFNSRDEANKWRQKLLNDGYNAMVQP